MSSRPCTGRGVDIDSERSKAVSRKAKGEQVKSNLPKSPWPLWVIACVGIAVSTRGAETDLKALLAAAKSGQTVEIPAGVFRGPAVLPAGVSLKGAGYAKTIIDAAGVVNGLVVSNGGNVVVSDLTVRNANEANLLVEGVEKVTLRRGAAPPAD